MTNYTKSTNFASKDSLASGNPLKIVKGTEIDAEFNNIATAVNTKADSLSPTFTGTPLAPTAGAGTSTTQVATTAFTMTALQAVFPVGSIYINASNSANPSTLFGFGTWVAMSTGKVLVNIAAGDASFNSLGQTGGNKDAVVVSHTHTATVTDPGHSHSLSYIAGYQGNPSNTNEPVTGPGALVTSSATTGISVSNSSTGSSATNANLQPYIVVAMWERTA